MQSRTRTRPTTERGRRSTIWRRLFSGRRRLSPATIIMVVVFLLFAVNFVNQIIRQAQLEQYRDSLAVEVAEQTARNAELKREVEYVESSEYAELVAREQLGYARPGDVVMMPTYPNQTSDSVESSMSIRGATSIVTTPSQPNWQRWWQFIQSTP
ncbi:MAG: FtsB family cell division protein [Roseiflexaceae bacterium]